MLLPLISKAMKVKYFLVMLKKNQKISYSTMYRVARAFYLRTEVYMFPNFCGWLCRTISHKSNRRCSSLAVPKQKTEFGVGQ